MRVKFVYEGHQVRVKVTEVKKSRVRGWSALRLEGNDVTLCF